MANKQRYRSGPYSTVPVRIDAGDEVFIGDLMGKSGNYADSFGNLALGTEAFHDVFIGVLVEGQTTGDEEEDSDALVADQGEFEFDLATTADQEWPVGSIVGATGSQQVQLMTGEDANLDEAVGRLAKRVVSGDTTCLVRIDSTVMKGGAQAPA